ncbi:pilin [Actinokineospora terrae]|uniref:TrbC/VIRB2 family protein n=1 Tax=Actinokineospora terrae TaxID=155974 RepID=A0A1H9T160_9PSEU|nr:hypothetical protein SAMN04487818_10624 [Actinokineospora terrae]
MRLNPTHPSLSHGRALDHETAVDRPDTTPTTTPTVPWRCPSDTVPTGRRRPCRRGLVVLGLVASAVLATVTPAHADTVVLAIAGSVDEVLTNIRNWLMGILALLATVFLTIGGVRRVFGGGDPGEQEKSKEAFKAAGIGYALAALAPLVVTVLKGIVGG